MIAYSNVSDEDMTLFYLVKQGYGSLQELRQLDTPELFDIIEYEQITSAIERYKIEGARNG